MDEVLKTAVLETLNKLGLPSVDFVVEHPADLAHGDYACNVALVLAKVAGKSPRVLAEEIKEALEGQIEYVQNIEIAGPGFLNFYLTRDFFSAEIKRSIDLGEKWGRNNSWSDKTVLVEYTDANPFKEFHVGHLFANAVGESIARLFMVNGANTKRVNYQGDVGLHVAHAIWGMQKLGINPEGDFGARELGRAYALGATAYKEDEGAMAEMRTINKAVYERSDENINALYDAGRKVSLDYFETIYQVLGTKFDSYFFESEVGAKGKDLVLNNPDIFTLSDGARVFVGEEYGLHTRVFLNKEGLPTYEAKELALAKAKEDRLGHYDWSVISTASEITEYFKVLKKAMSLVFEDLALKTEHVGHGMVRLTSGKMSSRTGDVIPALDFIDEVAEAAAKKMAETGEVEPDFAKARVVAVAAIKYATLRGNISQNSIFDKEKALSFEGDSGPYLQYTHARIASLARKATPLNLVASVTLAPETAFEVERILYRFPEVVKEALKDRAPHKVAGYITELAGAFNSFYAHEKIVDADDTYAPYKLAVAVAVKQTLQNGLWVLGIEAPEEM